MLPDGETSQLIYAGLAQTAEMLGSVATTQLSFTRVRLRNAEKKRVKTK